MEMQDDTKERAAGSPAGGASILDVLNADCWRLVLNHLAINDLVRSERVSRAWQQVVWDYLPGVHNIYLLYSRNNLLLSDKDRSYRKIELSEDKNLLVNNIIMKLGPCIVRIKTYRLTEEWSRAIKLYCPRLKGLTINEDEETRGKEDKDGLYDDCLRELVTIETLKELAINGRLFSTLVTGSFLSNLETNLKTLALNSCYGLLLTHALSAVKHLSRLTRLELNDNTIQTKPPKNFHLLLNEMPNLKHLSLMNHDKAELSSEVAASIGRLGRLRELCLWGNRSVTDSWLASAARGCPELRFVDVGCCIYVTPRGVVALCRARPGLVELVVAGLGLTDADLEACARSCTGLELLDSTYCDKPTQGLPARLAWPRARPLRLRVSAIALEQDQADYEGLILDNGGW